MMHMNAATTTPVWTLGDRLAKARKQAGIGSEQMATKLGVSRTTISNYEAGRTDPTLGLVVAWAEECAVPIEWLTRSRCFSEHDLVFDGPIAA